MRDKMGEEMREPYLKAQDGDLESKEGEGGKKYLYAGHGMERGWTGKMFKCETQLKR